ncbi:MAG TPA: ABC transporter permease [Streptosporangiaceae bacterium]|nr:ABC transporter permease [Streptosporangiaceae bacterium]
MTGQVAAAVRPEAIPASRPGVLSRLWRQGGSRAGLIILVVMIVGGLVSAAGLAPAPSSQNPLATLKGPALAHLFGTDQFGRDVFTRVLAGTLLSLQTAVVAVLICAVIGTLAGVAAGFLGGWVNWTVTSGADLIFAVPSILLALAIVSALGPGWQNTAIAVGVSYTPIFIRVVRGPVLAVRQADYVKAGQVLGFSRSRLLVRHILPSVGGVLAVQVTLALGWAVLTEASLDFLGLGPPPPAATLGQMVSDGTGLAGIAWWNLAFPALAVAGLVMAFNLVGDGLRDALDPTR